MVPHESRYAKYADYIGRRRWTNAQLKMGVPPMNEQKTRQRLNAVENAIAQQRLEGLEVQPDVIEEMKRAARGEIEIEEGIRNTLRKYTHAKVRGERPLP